MLSELYIENLAVIEKTDIQLKNGLNVFTGETGAGKSIVIDAINAVLGQRSNRELVRHGKEKASITARFTDICRRAADILEKNGYQTENGDIIIMREIFADGKSAARLMGKPVTVALLKEIGTELINIHGQHDNQILLSPERHIEILDNYGDYRPLISEYYDRYHRVVMIKREIKKISMDEDEKVRRIDLLTFQVDEIFSAELKEGEEETLLQERAKVKNAVKIIEMLSAARHAIIGDDGDGGALDMAQMAAKSLSKAQDYYGDEEDDLYSRADDVANVLSELLSDIDSRLEQFDFNEGYLTEVEDRLNEISDLRKKYGNTVLEILEYADKAKQELDTLTLSEQRLIELNEEGQKEYASLLEVADRLTNARKAAAKRFVDSIASELEFLDMPNVKVEAVINETRPNSRGRDIVEFLISTNKGEPPKPIAKIASGGELSRIMLAIKNTLADKDEVQTLIFDEIDTGVSGRAAQKIGLKLKQAAKSRQVLSVTHSAQIAALADHHYLIRKDSDDTATYTNVSELDYNGRIGEVARIMSTDKITDLMLKSAEEMIKMGNI